MTATIGPLESGDLYSSAFQFYSHISASVDPRTGMYMASIDLATGEGNHLRGPHFGFRLSYSPLSQIDEGFGSGWRLVLTELDGDAGMLSLASGDSHKVENLRPGVKATFPDRKLESCSLIVTGNAGETAVVEHITGIVEHLALPTGRGRILRPERLTHPNGDALHLKWELTPAGLVSLTKVFYGEDAVLLSLDYTSTTTTILRLYSHLPDPIEIHFTRQGNLLRRVTIPVITKLNVDPLIHADDEAAWEFSYTQTQDGTMRLLESMVSPDGVREEVSYSEQALVLPAGAPRAYMPAAVLRRRRLVSSPETILQTSRFTYDNVGAHNFYGYPEVRTWENRQDQLLHLIGAGAYRYGSTETQLEGTSPVCEIVRTYDQFHLILSEVTTRGEVVQEVVTRYGAVADQPFSRQPASFQLPHRVTTTTYDKRQPGIRQVTYVESEYDDQGNVLARHDSATGTTERSTYYPATGETAADGTELCPPDPLGLVRRLKSRTSEPGPAGGPSMVTRYRYCAVPVLSTILDRSVYVQACGEIREAEGTDGTVLLDRSERSFITDGFRQHGSVSEESLTRDDLIEHKAYVYTNDDTERSITTTTTSTTHDGISRTTQEKRHLISGLTQSTVDHAGNRIEAVYDGLARLIRETRAPGDADYQTDVRWQYQLSMGERWVQRIGITGLPHRRWLDEQGRETRREEPLPDGSLIVVREVAYDLFGQVLREVEIDPTAGGADLRIETHYAYDDWGKPARVTGTDGADTFNETTLVEREGEVMTRTTQWRRGVDGSVSGWQSTDTDAAGRQRYERTGTWSDDGEPVPYASQRWDYDGLGRCIATTDALGRVTTQSYDARNRLIETGLPDGTLVHRDYAPGHEGEFVARLWITPPDGGTDIELGRRSWDGLGRITMEHAGSLVYGYTYVPGQVSAASKTMPAGGMLDMSYDRRLGEVLKSLSMRDRRGNARAAITEATYDARIGLPTSIATPGGAMDIRLDYLGRMTEQTITLADGTPRVSETAVTPAGRELAKLGVDGERQTFRYDEAGRLSGIADVDVDVALAYDDLSQLIMRTTRSTRDDRTIVERRAYDALGRVTGHTWVHHEGATSRRYRLELAWREDAKVTERRWYGADDTLVRRETMTYDLRGRLEDHIIEAAGQSDYPADEMAHPYRKQHFEHDCIDNLLRVETTLVDGRTNETIYGYDTVDRDRVVSVANGLEGYPGHGQPLRLFYDANGNLIDDGQGRTFQWDDAGRLMLITLTDGTHIEYMHGPDGRVATVTRDGHMTTRYRENGAIAFEHSDSEARRFVRAPGGIVAECKLTSAIRDVILLGIDPQGSVITEGSTEVGPP